MKTENLIQAIIRDDLVPRKLFNRAALIFALAGFVFAIIIFFGQFNMRYNLFSTGLGPTSMKLLFTISLIAAATFILLRNVRPSDETLSGLKYPILPAIIFAAFIIYDFATLGTDRLAFRFYGLRHLVCVTAIISVAILPLTGMLWALKNTAPRNPMLVGAMAGAISGGAAATVYALYCSNDSPLFLTWYIVAIAIMSAAGGLIAKRLLVW